MPGAGRPPGTPAGAGARSSRAGKKFPARVPPPHHPPGPLDAPPGFARSRTLAAPRRPAGTRPPTPPALRLPQESPTQPPRAGTRTDSPAPSATLRTLRRAPLEKALAREEGLGNRGRASRQVHSGGGSLPLGLTPAAHGSWLRDDQSRRPAFQSTGRGGRRDRAGRGWRGGPLRRAPRRRRGAKSSRGPRGALRVPAGAGGGVRRKPWAQRGKACPSRGASWLRPGPEAPPGPKLCVHSHSPPPFHPAPACRSRNLPVRGRGASVRDASAMGLLDPSFNKYPRANQKIGVIPAFSLSFAAHLKYISINCRFSLPNNLCNPPFVSVSTTDSRSAPFSLVFWYSGPAMLRPPQQSVITVESRALTNDPHGHFNTQV